NSIRRKELMNAQRLEVNSRVWAAYGLHNHGRDKVNVPAQTGGKIISKWNEFSTMDNPLYKVQWDTGQQSIHYSNTLYAIGQAKDYVEFQQNILDCAERAELIIGPTGETRRLKIYLKNGDWIDGLFDLREKIETAN